MPIHVEQQPPIVLGLKHDKKRLIHGIIEQARETPWSLHDLLFTKMSFPSNPGPVGAIVDCFGSAPLTHRLYELGLPAVRAGDIIDKSDNALPCVLLDRRATGRMAADHFAARGIRDFGYVGNMPFANSSDLYQGFCDRVEELGLNSHLLQVFNRTPAKTDEERAAKHEKEARKIIKWLKGLPKPVGLLGYNDQMAGRLCTICRSAHFVVPDEIAIIGTNNEAHICELSPVELSSIDVDRKEQGRQAVLLLERLINGELAPKDSIMIPPKEVVVRKSTDLPVV